LTHGLAAGVVGYAVVVVFYAGWNALQGRSPFFTAALLGEAAFYGLKEPADVVVQPGPVLAFNGLHLVAFLVIGMIAAWLATQSERGAQFWYIGLSLFIYGLIHVLGLAIWLGEPLRGQLPVWSVVLATISALGAMSAYLLAVHPSLRQQLRRYQEDV
jgi:hypothetical protein